MRLILAILFSCKLLAEVIPDPLSGFTHEQTYHNDTSSQHGLFLNSSANSNSSPVVADLDQNRSNGLEIISVSQSAKVTAVNANGNIIWEQSLPNADCSKSDLVYSSPAVGELNNDGINYVVVGYGGLRTKACGGGIVAYRAHDGVKAWTFDLKKFAKKQKFYSVSHAVFAAPTIADVDHDGKLEIGFGALDRNVYLLNSKGKLLWYYQAADTVFSSPTFYNIDSDPDLEMIIGTDISRNSKIKPATNNGGNIYALKTTVRGRRKFLFRSSLIVSWIKPMEQVVQSSPVIADVLASNPGSELIIGSGCFFPQNNSNKLGKWIKILRLSDGKVLQTLNTNACLSSTVAVADLDGDGLNEIVAMQNGSTKLGGPGSGQLSVWTGSQADPIWSIEPRNQGQNDSYLGTFQSPVIGDLDGNGSLEIVISNSAGLAIFSGAGQSLTCNLRSCSDLPSLPTWSTLKNSPVIADINQDGILDLLVSGRHPSANKHTLYAWTNFHLLNLSLPGPHPAYFTPWGMQKKLLTRNAVN